MFSLGCILFMLATRIPVTEGQCDMHDSVYKHFIDRRPQMFWENRKKISIRYHQDFDVSKDLKDLINKLICADPDNRLTIEQIRAHIYMQGKMTSQKALVKFFAKRLSRNKPN